ncbi:MAG: hypothetical protein QHC90_24275 [Shinella sp.]|nr:hypothetical protein [Shinella sp.]
MANNYYDGTGLLVLDTVTPIIRALFDGYALDVDYPGSGDAYIALVAESNSPDWDDIMQNLLDLAVAQNIPVSNRDEPTIQSVLCDFMSFLGVSDQDHLAQLMHLIEHHNFDNEADLEELFLIATCFNDGHNLTAIKFEGCWRCDKPRLFEFGGNSYFISRRLNLSIDTSRPLEMFDNLHRALVDNDLPAAAALIVNEMTRLLAGIVDPDARAALRELVAERLLHSSSPAP